MYAKEIDSAGYVKGETMKTVATIVDKPIKKFTELGLASKNDLWRHVLSNFIIFSLMIIFLTIPLFLSEAKTTFENTDKKIMQRGPYIIESNDTGEGHSNSLLKVSLDLENIFWFFYVVVGPFIIWLLGIYLTNRFIHGREFRSLISTHKIPRLGRFAEGFVVFFLLTILELFVSYLSDPGNFAYVFNFSKFLPYLPVLIITFFIQAPTEELFFRGYGLQFWRKYTKNPIVLIIVTSVIFALFHSANPETSGDWFIYLLSICSYGILFAAITLRENGLEVSMGAHVANNLSSILVNYKGSALENLPSVFMLQNADFSYLGLVFLVLKSLAFYYIVFRNSPKWDPYGNTTKS